MISENVFLRINFHKGSSIYHLSCVVQKKRGGGGSVKTLTFLDESPHSECLLHHAKVMQIIQKIYIFFPLNHLIRGIVKSQPCHNATL